MLKWLSFLLIIKKLVERYQLEYGRVVYDCVCGTNEAMGIALYFYTRIFINFKIHLDEYTLH